MAEAPSSAPGPETTSLPASEIEPPGAHPEGKMFRKIISSGLTIRPQQRGEPELTDEEKHASLSSLLHARPGTFLMRFGRVLDGRDLEYFSGSSDYEVQFHVKELGKHLVPANRNTRTRNRRFECMKELMETDYFSEGEMRQRNPLLFTHYVGKYMSEGELAVLDGHTGTDMALSSLIMSKMRQDERRERERLQSEKEGEQVEEEDTSSEEEMESVSEEQVTETEKSHLRQEFLRAMQLSFLRGEDREFDYGSVDNNDRYDSVETLQQDGEDLYFDEEEPQWCDDDEEEAGLEK